MIGNVYFVGFMGSGKTAVGQRLASMLNRRFVDMDGRLVRRLGMPIAEVFARRGEAVFRNAEVGLLRELSGRKRLVVATGGGVPERKENRDLMRRSGIIVYLKASLHTCMQRLTPQEEATRPLWTDAESLERRFERRRPLYDDCDLRVSVDDRGLDEMAQTIVGGLSPDRDIPSVLGHKECPIICSWHTPEALNEFIRGRRVVILTDRQLARLHLQRFSEVLGDPMVFVISPGERSKTLRSAQRVYTELLGYRIERGDLLVAMGGGVVTDLGAFVAATYKRGMGFALVSTTLLGCVDAAIGGKAAVNMDTAKNAIGCFTIPEAVFLDIPALKTLPRKRVVEGLVEAYKTGLAASPKLVAFVEEELPALLAKDLPAFAELVGLSAKAKADVISGDFEEKGLRRILNFGHTFGHAIEGWGRFRITHGEAVAAGMIVAARLSSMRGLLPEDLEHRISSTVRKIVPRFVECPSPQQAWDIMENDKKVQRGKVVFVLLKGLGEPICVDDVSMAELSRAVLALGGS